MLQQRSSQKHSLHCETTTVYCSLCIWLIPVSMFKIQTAFL